MSDFGSFISFSLIIISYLALFGRHYSAAVCLVFIALAFFTSYIATVFTFFKAGFKSDLSNVVFGIIAPIAVCSLTYAIDSSRGSGSGNRQGKSEQPNSSGDQVPRTVKDTEKSKGWDTLIVVAVIQAVASILVALIALLAK